MKTFIKSTRGCVVHLIIYGLLFLAFTAQGQRQDKKSQIIRVKLTEKAASALESRSFTISRTGALLTGLSRVDQVNEQYRVKSMRRMFRDAGKFEAKHRAHGLHLWYEIIYDKSATSTSNQATLSAVKSSYEALPDIQVAELILDKSIDNIDDFSSKDYSRFSLENGSNDTFLADQWHYNNTGQTGGTPGADISLLDAWTQETGSSEVIVAVTDWSVDVTHEDIMDNMWVNQNEIPGNGIDDDGNGFIDDVNGYDFGNDRGELVPYNDHGMHVAGTVAAESNNGIGVAGIAGGSGSGDGVRIMSCGVFSDENRGGFAETYIYAADNGAVISQNSWNYTSPGVVEQSVLDAIDYFIAEAGYDENGNPYGPMQGGVVVFSAGNDGTGEEWWPGYYEPVVAVAATDHNDVRADFSNYGDWIDVSAPGVAVMSTFLDDEYNTASGTSMACPHVSGVAALIVSKFAGNITPEEVKDRIVRSADVVSTLAPGSGRGRLNAYYALQEDDNEGPETINDVVVVSSSQRAITLQWTAPADSGNVVEYDLRYSTQPINDSNFAEAIKFEDVSYPLPAGKADTIEVSNLQPGTTYYFAVKSIDFFGNVSSISNVVMGSLLNAPKAIVSPDSVAVSQESGQITTVPLTIINDGQTVLNYSFPDFADSAEVVIMGQGEDLNYGYTWKDSDEVGGPSFLWNDISESGVEVPSSGGEVDLPFIFEFYGQEKTSLKISQYGYLTFGNITSDRSNDPIPHNNDPNDYHRDPNDYIAPMWDGLTKGQIYYEVNEERLIVQYDKKASFTYWGDALFTFQVVLTSSGNIYFYYKELETPDNLPEVWPAYAATVGIENADASDGVEVTFDGQILKDSLAIAIYKPVDLLSVSPVSGTVAVGDSAVVEVAVDSRGVNAGTYFNNLVLNTDDPFQEEITIPFEVEVVGSPQINVVPAQLDFGAVAVDSTASITFSIANTGADNLTVTSISHQNNNFDISLEGPFNIAPGLSLQIPVTYSPQDSTGDSDEIIIVSNDAYGSDQAAVSLVGNTSGEGANLARLQGQSEVISELAHYPNPADNTSTLKYVLKEGQHVEIQIINMKGQVLFPVTSGWENEGTHQVTQDLTGLPNGLYMYKITIGDETYLSRLMVE
ncbi:S8 family serine peptidase [Fulvivirga maritima]|uniref:S8 family serine peptidase n=1 Tax=Fulvivirga maritima TaxID=2904247 RepID=UPI001F2D3AA3|nr:S8 family serine peptidase [Fulvivirga maritima]UII25196.1 S8 family serine peptidase [Fulvivirga maritima]